MGVPFLNGNANLTDAGAGFDQFQPSTVLMEDAGGGMVMAQTGEPHIALAGLILLLLAFKVITESRAVSINPQEARVSLYGVANVGVQAVVFILFLKLGSAYLLKRGIVVPGLPDLAGAI